MLESNGDCDIQFWHDVGGTGEHCNSSRVGRSRLVVFLVEIRSRGIGTVPLPRALLVRGTGAQAMEVQCQERTGFSSSCGDEMCRLLTGHDYRCPLT